jgi:hypothetical protein
MALCDSIRKTIFEAVRCITNDARWSGTDVGVTPCPCPAVLLRTVGTPASRTDFNAANWLCNQVGTKPLSKIICSNLAAVSLCGSKVHPLSVQIALERREKKNLWAQEVQADEGTGHL